VKKVWIAGIHRAPLPQKGPGRVETIHVSGIIQEGAAERREGALPTTQVWGPNRKEGGNKISYGHKKKKRWGRQMTLGAERLKVMENAV